MIFYEIEYSSNSITDIKRIHDYIAYEKKEPENAQIIAESIHESVKRLNMFPNRFPVIFEKNQTEQYRSIPKNGYLIIYQVIEEKHKVVIVRILGSKQDVQ